jgi:hypothetical protein
MRNALIRLALAWLIFSPVAAFAQAQRCVPIEAALAFLEKYDLQHRVLFDDERKRAVDLFNNTPLEGEFTFEIAIWSEGPNGTGMLWFGNGSELCARMMFPPEAAPQVRRMIEGPKA